MQAGLEREWETTHPSARLLYGLISFPSALSSSSIQTRPLSFGTRHNSSISVSLEGIDLEKQSSDTMYSIGLLVQSWIVKPRRFSHVFIRTGYTPVSWTGSWGASIASRVDVPGVVVFPAGVAGACGDGANLREN
jgi:hypothetical protein